MTFDENCPKRKPSNSQVHVYAVITFQFEKKNHKTLPTNHLYSDPPQYLHKRVKSPL